MILNCSEAARNLGYLTRTTLQRLLAAGLLDDYRRPGGGRQALLETAPEGLPTLRQRVRALVQVRYSSPLWRRIVAEETPELERVAQRSMPRSGAGRQQPEPKPWPLKSPWRCCSETATG